MYSPPPQPTHLEARYSDGDRDNVAGGARKRGLDERSAEPSQSNGDERKKTRKVSKRDAERPQRILGRRYELTRTGYKFVEVGVAVVLPCYVTIVIGDCHGKEISLSPETWREFLDQRRVVLSHLHSGENHAPPPPMCLADGNLTLRFGRIHNQPILRIDTSTTRLVASMSTVLFLFDLELCVNRVIVTLSSMTGRIDSRLSRFLAIAATVADPANVSRAIRESETFDRGDIVDCELAALCFGRERL